jgi:sarcosine oxidase subunit gamma
MPETLLRRAHQMPAAPAPLPGQDTPLLAHQTAMAVINLRGNPEDGAWLAAVAQTLDLALPLGACTTTQRGDDLRVVWAGPDEWLLIAPAGQQARLVQDLRAASANQHHAVTDVSGGFFLVELRGPQAREVLAQGCPMDLHPRAFPDGRAVGTHFFKVGLTLWRGTSGPQSMQMLVRRSFIDHFWQLIEHTSLSCGRTVF